MLGYACGRVGWSPVQIDNVAAMILARLAGGALLQGGDVVAEKLPVYLEVSLVRRHVDQISQVADENSLEDVLVQVAGVIVITGVHQNTVHRHPPASTG